MVVCLHQRGQDDAGDCVTSEVLDQLPQSQAVGADPEHHAGASQLRVIFAQHVKQEVAHGEAADSVMFLVQEICVEVEKRGSWKDMCLSESPQQRDKAACSPRNALVSPDSMRLTGLPALSCRKTTESTWTLPCAMTLKGSAADEQSDAICLHMREESLSSVPETPVPRICASIWSAWRSSALSLASAKVLRKSA